MTLPPQLVWENYRMRADAENRIQERKYDSGAGSFNLKDFYAKKAALNFVMMAYNFFNFFRKVVIITKVHE
ncbi:MAG: transposase [Flavobacteriales bacterium]|nr:transposase [Flavobacteriales bacterium]MCX7649517.1 transposase [Flavobacteriales bacterium]MDW8431777.1 transposase [Flavobacteriales bacterium]